MILFIILTTLRQAIREGLTAQGKLQGRGSGVLSVT